MSAHSYLDGRVVLHPGEALAVVRGLADASIDAVVTDPPYALVSIGRRFGKPGAAGVKVREGASGAYARAAAGFMGKAWDTGETAFAVDFWAEIWRVLKPGGHVVAFGGTRSYHRLACAIEDAGFEIRDQLAWAYASGFPKSHDVAKGIDKAAGATRDIVSERFNRSSFDPDQQGGGGFQRGTIQVSAPATDAARAWEGWGTALKPAWEPICLARKPLIGTVAANVLAHGTGALNIDGCRVGLSSADRAAIDAGVYRGGPPSVARGAFTNDGSDRAMSAHPGGRWPANLLHDGSDEVIAAFPAGAARFFFSAKADSEDRLGSKHPTVKPVDLMQWLVRMITPPGGLVLDPFAGTGTTGEAAFREGMRAVLVEREADYQADIARRMGLVLAGPRERRQAAARPGPPEMGSLFAPIAAE